MEVPAFFDTRGWDRLTACPLRLPGVGVAVLLKYMVLTGAAGADLTPVVPGTTQPHSPRAPQKRQGSTKPLPDPLPQARQTTPGRHLIAWGLP